MRLLSWLGGPAAGRPRRTRRTWPGHGDPLLVERLDDRNLPSFVGPVDYADPSPFDVAAADVTGDGRVDLVSANSANTVTARVGNGDGTFGPAVATTVTGASPYALAVGDLDGDGAADVVTLNPTGASVLLANGGGTFRPGGDFALPGQHPPGYTESDPLAQSPQSLVLGDLNGDGTLDLVVGGSTFFTVYLGTGYYGPYYEYHQDGYVNVLLGNGDGTFTPAETRHTGADIPVGVAVGDLDGDGDLDVAADAYPAAVNVLLGDGQGGLGAPVGSAAGSYGFDLINNPVGDFDGDGRLDLVTSSGYSVGLLRGNGDGTFDPPELTNLDAYSYTYANAVVAGDVNGDGTLDLTAVTGDVRYRYYGYYGAYDPYTTRSARVLLGYGDGTFARPQASDFGTRDGYGYVPGAALADFDGDGDKDLAAADPYSGVFTARNAGDWVVPAALSISDASVTEGNSGTVAVTFTVTLTRPNGQPVTVNYATANGSALAGSDYQTATGTLTFTPGGPTTQTVTVFVVGDGVDEPNQTFFVNLSAASNADLADGQGVGTIIDDDPAPTLAISNASVQEGQQKQTRTIVFTVTLTGATENTVFVNFNTMNGTATTTDQDYRAQTGTLRFDPGTTRLTISVTVVGDKQREGDETFSVLLSGATSATIADGTGLGTILDDDGPGPGKGNGNPHK